MGADVAKVALVAGSAVVGVGGVVEGLGVGAVVMDGVEFS